MITSLDTLSWSDVLVSGNADFIEVTLPGSPPGGPTIFVVSNVRNNSFEVIQSAPFPPTPGPGSVFNVVASYLFPQPNLTFDPVIAYDTSGDHPLIHIIGTQNTPTGGSPPSSSSQYSDVVKFTYDTVTQALTGPIVLSSGTRIRSAYDIAVLPNGDQIVAMSLAEPAIQGANSITFVSVASDTATLTLGGALPPPFVPGQWVLLDNFTNASFLNGQIVQVTSASAGNFSFVYNLGGSYNAPESSSACAQPVGDSLLALRISTVPQGSPPSSGDTVVPGSAAIIESSPARTGNAFDGVSLVTSGNTVELYYQTHPKLVTFQDQVFTIKTTASASGFGANFGFGFGDALSPWTLPTVVTTYSGRYSDNRLTVLADAGDNLYLSQTYWNQFNHPYGIVGNVLLGYQPSGGSWSFRSTLGTFAGGSIVQSTLALSQSGAANLMYLLQPFDQIANPPSTTTASYPLQVASVDPSNLVLTNVPGFYNSVNFTWLRGTKSLIDSGSVWAMVGEREVLTAVAGEAHTISAIPGPYTVQVADHSGYFENLGVTYAASGAPLVQVVTAPQRGQYTVEPSTGLYTFSMADAGAQVTISYNYVSGIQPAYASFFNVPPVASLAPEATGCVAPDIVVYRASTFYSTDTACITQIGINLSSGVITIVCNNDFVPGDEVALYNAAATPAGSPPALGVSTAFLNGVTLTVSTASPTQFTAPISVELAGFFAQYLGFGSDFGGVGSLLSTGVAANLTAGALTFSAAGSIDADNDAMEFFWSENDPDLADVTLTPNGSQATLNVARHVGPNSRSFEVGVTVVDLYPDLVTQRHPALLVSNASVSGSTITITFVPPGGAGFGSTFGAHFGSLVPSSATIVPAVGDKVMLYGMVLAAPQGPTLGQIPGGSLPAQNNLSVIITYVNNSGETVGSGSSIINVAANNLLVVNSPGYNGSATAYNVYVGAPGSETLQTLVPLFLGSTFMEPTAGFRASFQTPPQTSTALEQVLNDQFLTITSVSTTANTFKATFTPTLAGTFGTDFGINFNGNYSGNYSASLSGFVVNEFQWDIADVFVPQNVAPTIIFPSPQWGTGNTLVLDLARNTQITITPSPSVSNPTTQFPVIYAGIYDPDDVVTYLWKQTSGTPVTTLGNASSTLSFFTNGANINGETLSFTLTVNDSVNPPVTASFSVNVASIGASTKDTLQLSRSVWSQTADIGTVTISGGVATIMAANTFLVGEPVRLSGLTTASFLNGVGGFVKATVPAGFGSNFGFGFGNSFTAATAFQFATTLSDYPTTADTGVAYGTTPISQRNLPQVWSPLDISVLFSDLNSVKRVSVIDGSDRYIVISPYSVLVYGVFPSANPVAVLLRRLITPNRTAILDAVHTEQDYTLVLDSTGNIFRYSTAPLINTDNPDKTLVLTSATSLSFADPDLDNDVKIMTTPSFGNSRIVVLSGERGAVLLQLNTTTLAVQGTLAFLTSDNLLYGANAIQFVRWVNMDNLRSGRVLLGSVVYNSAKVTQVAAASNALTITCQNTFAVGDRIILSGMVGASFLNGAAVTVISATATQFEASFQYSGSYGPAIETSGFAESQTSGTTYETLVDLGQGQIIGTWDKSKLRNQFVETGEILFQPDSTYSGAPIPPVLLTPSASVQGAQTFVTLTWKQERPDLINSYIVSYAIETQVVGTVPLTAPYTFQIPIAFSSTADEGATDTSSPVTITAIQVNSGGFGEEFGLNFGSNIGEITVTGNNNFGVDQGVFISGLTGLPTLIGQTLVISSLIGAGPMYTGFTAPLNSPNLSLTPVVGNGFVSLNTPLVAVAGVPLAGQYAVTPTGLYTFNAAQAGHTVTISVRQPFNALQTVNSGATQSIVVPMAAGQTYFFEVQAIGLDGASGESNAVSISI